MRRFILIAALFEAALWVWTVAEAANQPVRRDISVYHAIFFFFALPALGLGLWGRWLGLALGLVSVALFLSFSVFAAGKISG